MFKVITGTLQANHNTMQLTDETITNDSIFEVYADTENVIPSSVSVGGHTVTITFDSKPSNNVGIKVLINNIVGEFEPPTPVSAISYRDSTGGSGLVIGYMEEVTGYPPQPVLTPVYNGVDIEELVPLNTVLGGVLYHATTGNTWKKLDASNLDYDSESTIYSAMGDIDELETENKNLVAAINEVNAKPSGGSFNISTVETKTGKKLNNKDIYIKSYTYTGGIASSGTNIGSSVIDNLSEIEFIVNAYFFRTNNTRTFSPIATYMSGTNLSIRTMYNADASSYGCLVFEYTKVGDV